VILEIREMMATGTVKSFNRLKGYGFIRKDSDGKEVFVHLSMVQKAGHTDLRKGEKVSFDIFYNQGKAAARNLCVDSKLKAASKNKMVAVQDGITQNARYAMSQKKAEQLKGKRTSITRAALELAIAETVRASDPKCKGLVGIIVERVVPKASGGANWAVKGVKFGKAERDQCSAAIAKCVEDGQREFVVSD
jgi:CspA family cold shock protein